MLSRQRIELLAVLIATGIPSLALADVSISSKPTANMSCDTGVCTATAKKAVLNVGDLQTMLASGDVAVKTGSVAKDIDVDQPLTWATTSRLTLDAQQSVTVKKQVTVSGTGALTVTTNDGGKHGEFVIEGKASVQFWELASSLIIDGNSYTLVGDIKTLAADIAANPSGFYALAKPYDASGDGTYSGTPVNELFSGTFEGLGNTISNFAAEPNKRCEAGLFHRLEGSIRDFGLLDASLTVTAGRCALIGGIVILNQGGVLERVHASGKIVASVAGGGALEVGGLVEENMATFKKGKFIGGVISKSSTHMQIEVGGGEPTAPEAGGLVYYDDSGTIDQSYSDTRIIARNGLSVGGLAATTFGGADVSNSYAVKPVQSTRDRGGIVGGLIGFGGGPVSTSYSIGNVVSGKGKCGGLVGWNVGPGVSQSYWDSDTSGCGGAGSALTDEQFKSQLPDGFDPAIWGQSPSINNGYPYLLANPPQ